MTADCPRCGCPYLRYTLHLPVDEPENGEVRCPMPDCEFVERAEGTDETAHLINDYDL